MNCIHLSKVNDQLTNQVDCLKNESKELRNRLNVIETESKSTRPRSKAKHTVQAVQALRVSSPTSITTNQTTLGKHEKSMMQLVNKKSHEAQTKVKSNNGNNAILSEVPQPQAQCQQHKQPKGQQQQQQHSQQ